VIAFSSTTVTKDFEKKKEGEDDFHSEFVGLNACHGPLAGDPAPDIAEVGLRIGVRSNDKNAVERFTKEIRAACAKWSANRNRPRKRRPQGRGDRRLLACVNTEDVCRAAGYVLLSPRRFNNRTRSYSPWCI
jgi:hypothetical protein